jgi:D-arabinose 1-dehydrogenase-like Zn-dependent alcohol dehydrogenase
MNVRGKAVVVTGAGRGIGRAIAIRMAAEGAHVVVNNLDADAATVVAQEDRRSSGSRRPRHRGLCELTGGRDARTSRRDRLYFGSAAVQHGKAAGARVAGVVGGPKKVDVARRLGADVVVDRHSKDFVEVVKDDTDSPGADMVYDPVGGDAYQRSTKCPAFEGQIFVVGFAGGQIQSAALNHALFKNYSIVGLHWGLYTTRNPALVRDCHDELSMLAADGSVKPLVSERLTLDSVADGCSGSPTGPRWAG